MGRIEVLMEKVAIVIPTYNQARYLTDSVGSALRQSGVEVEVWIGDDASTDETPSVAQGLVGKDSRIRYFRLKENVGQCNNINWIMPRIETEIVVLLDSDDILDEKYCSVLGNLLKKYPSAGYAHASVGEINKNGQLCRMRRLNRSNGYMDADRALAESVKGYQVAANIITFRRKALASVNFMEPGMTFAQDWDLSVRLADRGWGNVYCNQALAYYRVWTDSGNVRPKRKRNEVNGCRHVLEKSLKSAFVRRNWPLAPIEKRARFLAATHSLALASNIFSPEERKELIVALRKLGAGPRLSFHLCLIQWRFGGILQFCHSLRIQIKTFLKEGLYRAKRLRNRAV